MGNLKLFLQRRRLKIKLLLQLLAKKKHILKKNSQNSWSLPPHQKKELQSNYISQKY